MHCRLTYLVLPPSRSTFCKNVKFFSACSLPMFSVVGCRLFASMHERWQFPHPMHRLMSMSIEDTPPDRRRTRLQPAWPRCSPPLHRPGPLPTISGTGGGIPWRSLCLPPAQQRRCADSYHQADHRANSRHQAHAHDSDVAEICDPLLIGVDLRLEFADPLRLRSDLLDGFLSFTLTCWAFAPASLWMLPLWQPAQTSRRARKLWLLMAGFPDPLVVAACSGFIWHDTQSMPLIPWTSWLSFVCSSVWQAEQSFSAGCNRKPWLWATWQSKQSMFFAPCWLACHLVKISEWHVRHVADSIGSVMVSPAGWPCLYSPWQDSQVAPSCAWVLASQRRGFNGVTRLTDRRLFLLPGGGGRGIQRGVCRGVGRCSHRRERQYQRQDPRDGDQDQPVTP